MKGAFLKIHYLRFEQDKKQYFHNTVSQTFTGLDKILIGRSSCHLFTFSDEVITSSFYLALPPVNKVLCLLISSIAHSTAVFRMPQVSLHLNLASFSLISSLNI